MKGFIFYRGASVIDGAPVVGIAVLHSSNEKTGGMVQTYILRDDMPPQEAVKTGRDVSICGQCPHRGPTADGKGRTCYVVIGRGPAAVYRSMQDGNYPDLSAGSAYVGTLRNRLVRLGAYGDPAAIPSEVWDGLLKGSLGWTGYTHQWAAGGAAEANALQLKRYLMASADTPEERTAAQAAGWRTFTVLLEGQERAKGDALCPSDKSVANPLQCFQCMACDGTSKGRKGSIAIHIHGGLAVMSNAKRLALRLS